MIKVNEKWIKYELGMLMKDLKEKYKKQADVLIYNGYPVNENKEIEEGSQVVLIKKGEIPTRKELKVCMVSRNSPLVYEKVCKAVIGIAGIGGLGSNVAITLARLGVGHLVVVDYDRVEPSNLNRQQYYVNQMGAYKVDALKENIKQINPYVKVEGYIEEIKESNIKKFFAGVDILVEGFDKAEAKAMLLDEMTYHYPEKWLILASGLAGYEDGNQIKTRKLGQKAYIVGDGKSGAEVGQGLMSPRVGIAASQQANKVLEILIGEL